MESLFIPNHDCSDYRRCDHYIDCLKSDICDWRGRMKPTSDDPEYWRGRMKPTSDDPESGCTGYKLEDKADGI